MLLFVLLALLHAEHVALNKQLAYEGAVLLENKNQALPIAVGSKLAVFGKAQNHLKPWGGGSGEVYAPYVRNILDGLEKMEKENKIVIWKDLYQLYRENYDKYYDGGLEPPITEEQYQSAKAFADVAIFMISRESGEMYDRTATQGDYYLSDAEEAILQKLISLKFPKLIVLLNIGNVGDSSWFKGREGIDAVLNVWFPGQEAGEVMLELLLGEGYPSGKLVDTMAKTWEDYPTSAGWYESHDFINYDEDIFVGYRYFETFPNAGAKVNYEFGYGLGYTTFSIDKISGKQTGNIQSDLVFEATVTNTGAFKGKEVVQVYVGAPQGKLGKPKKVLVGFVKTKELGPGEQQTVSVTVPIPYLASYDDLGKVDDAAFLLEAGDYLFFIGNSVRNNTATDYKLHIDATLVTSRPGHKVVPTKLARSLLADGTYEQLPVKPNAKESADESASANQNRQSNSEQKISRKEVDPSSVTNAILLKDVARDNNLMPQFLAQFSDNITLLFSVCLTMLIDGDGIDDEKNIHKQAL